MKKIHGVHKVLLQFKNTSLVLFNNATTESVNCSFVEKSRKTFLHRDLQQTLHQAH